jgi:hypothetical protein
MDAVTYPEADIIQAMNQMFVPTALDATECAQLADKYEILATPTFILTDSSLTLYHKEYGYFPPFEFLQMLRLMRAKVDLHRRNYDEAIERLQAVVDTAIKTVAAPEAIYLLGSAKYKKSGTFDDALQEWRKLKMNFPDSEWTKKVDYAL